MKRCYSIKLYIVNTVHYIWCGLKSVLKKVQPDLIIFHHEILPVVDKWQHSSTFFHEMASDALSVCCNIYALHACLIMVLRKKVLKGTHTIYFSSSLYIINQKPMIPRTHFHRITTWIAPSYG